MLHVTSILAKGANNMMARDNGFQLRACSRFQDKYAVIFANGGCFLSELQVRFDELAQLKGELETLAKRCEEFTRDVSTENPGDLLKEIQHHH
jgi:hypothetical protein